MTKNENINLILIHLFRPLSLGTLYVPYAIKSAKLNVDYQDIQTLNIITKINQMKFMKHPSKEMLQTSMPKLISEVAEALSMNKCYKTFAKFFIITRMLPMFQKIYTLKLRKC